MNYSASKNTKGRIYPTLRPQKNRGESLLDMCTKSMILTKYIILKRHSAPKKHKGEGIKVRIKHQLTMGS